MKGRKIFFAVTIFAAVVLSACASTKGTTSSAPPSSAGNEINKISQNKQLWETGWETLQSNARKEGKIVIYLGAGGAFVRDSYVQELKKFGIAAEFFTAAGGEQVNKISAERRAGIYNADVYVGGVTTLVVNLIPAGFIDTLESQLLLPEVKEGNSWRPGVLPWVDKEKRVFAFVAFADGGVAINTSMVRREEIVSFNDLLDPKWKENIVMNDPTVTGTGLSWFATTVKLMGLDYTKKLIAQKPVVSRDQRQQVDWFAKGKYPVGVGILSAQIEQFAASGAPIENYLLKEGSYVTSGAGNVALINNSPHPNASRFFINWLLSKNGQYIWSKEVRDLSQRLDVSTEYVSAKRIPDPGVKYLLEYTEESQLEKPKYIDLAKELLNSLK